MYLANNIHTTNTIPGKLYYIVHLQVHVHAHIHVHVYLHVLVHVHAILTVHFDYLCCT